MRISGKQGDSLKINRWDRLCDFWLMAGAVTG
jgi:hypothetical protein